MIKLGDSMLEILDEMPPRLVRIIARRRDKWRTPITNAEIVKASGLSHQKVAAISKMTTWSDVTIAELDAFRLACGVTPKNLKYHRAFIRRTNANIESPMRHLDHKMAKTRAKWRAVQ